LIGLDWASFRYEPFSQEWLRASKHAQAVHYMFSSYGRDFDWYSRPLRK
jgi:hypothetical protein